MWNSETGTPWQNVCDSDKRAGSVGLRERAGARRATNVVDSNGESSDNDATMRLRRRRGWRHGAVVSTFIPSEWRPRQLGAPRREPRGPSAAVTRENTPPPRFPRPPGRAVQPPQLGGPHPALIRPTTRHSTIPRGTAAGGRAQGGRQAGRVVGQPQPARPPDRPIQTTRPAPMAARWTRGGITPQERAAIVDTAARARANRVALSTQRRPCMDTSQLSGSRPVPPWWLRVSFLGGRSFHPLQYCCLAWFKKEHQGAPLTPAAMRRGGSSGPGDAAAGPFAVTRRFR